MEVGKTPGECTKMFGRDFAALRADGWAERRPNSITTLPFLDEEAKRNILGFNSARLFNLEVPKHKQLKTKPGKAPAQREPVTA